MPSSKKLHNAVVSSKFEIETDRMLPLLLFDTKEKPTLTNDLKSTNPGIIYSQQKYFDETIEGAQRPKSTKTSYLG